MIGRVEEKKVLKTLLTSGRPEFLAVYGRRRVGKTYLIREFFNGTFSFYATGVQSTGKKQQLQMFREALIKFGDPTHSVPSDWFEAFSRLQTLLEREDTARDYMSGRRVVFLDEISWMDTAKSEFKSAFEYFWNSWGSAQDDLLLIICASATSWIINNIAKSTGGFYNRLTRQIRLMPFTLSECEQILSANGMRMTRRQIVESYMIFGGVPYYLNYLDPEYSLAQNVDKLFFSENAPLKYEFSQMFDALFRKSDDYLAIIKALAKKKHGMTRTEMVQDPSIVSGKSLTRSLADLEQCGFIRKYQDYAKNVNGAHYQLLDPLCLFHLTFLDTGKIGSWMEYVNTPSYYAWRGLAFERVCFAHTGQIKKRLEIGGVSTNDYSWSSKQTTPGAQIDLLIDRKDDIIHICEIKFSQEEFVIDAGYEKELQHKVEAFRVETKTKKALWPTMITFSGLAANEYKHNILCEITGEDLFE